MSLMTEDEGCLSENDQLLNKPEDYNRSDRDILLVGRAEYRLTIHSPALFSSSSVSTVSAGEGQTSPGSQEIAYSTYMPNSYDRPIADYWVRAGVTDQLREEAGNEKLRVELRHDGVAVGVKQGGGVKWMTDLTSIG